MDHVKILKRAWHVVTRYRALWVFGIILALTTFSWVRTRYLFGSNNDASPSPGEPLQIDLGDGFFARYEDDINRDLSTLEQSFKDFFSHDPIPTLITIGIVMVCLVLALMVLSRIARYVSETALIKMVDQYEGTGEMSSVRQGLRMGWSRPAWQMFLIDLLTGLLLLVAFIVGLILAASPLLVFLFDLTALSIIGAIAVAGLVFLVIFLAIVAGEVLGLIKLFAYRACALDGLGIIDALRRGYDISRLHPKDVGLMWLLVLGIRIGWPIAMFPVGIILMVIAAILGFIVALPVGLIGGLWLKGLTLLLVTTGAGAFVFFLALSIPLALLDGLQKAFLSSTWTLVYQELRALNGLEAAQRPVKPTSPPLEQGNDASGEL